MPSTPPLSPTSSRDAARRSERSNCIIGSPESRRLPAGPSVPSISTPSVNQHLFGAMPTDLTTRLSSIPPQDNHNGPHASTSAIMLPPPVIPSMGPPALPSHRQTLSSAQLAAAFAALPPLPPAPQRRSRSMQPPIQQTLSSFQLMAAVAALPPLNPAPQRRSRSMQPPVSISQFFLYMFFCLT